MYETDEIEISSREIAENIGFKRRSSFWYSSSFDCLRIDYMFAIKFCATRNYIFDRGIEFIEDIKLQEWENKMSILGKRDNYNIVLGQLFAYTGNETELLIPPVQAVHKNVFSFSKVKKIILHPDFIYMPVVKDHSEVCKKSLSFTNEYENNIIIDASRVKPLYANIENPTELQRMMMNQLVYSDNIYISSPACEF
jgi:hypothetical protein